MIIFDIETPTLFTDPVIQAMPREKQITAMKFGIAVTCDTTKLEYAEWTDSDTAELCRYLVASGQIGGWNITEFDIPIVAAHSSDKGAAKLLLEMNEKKQVVDPFARAKLLFDRWHNLNEVAKRNLNQEKTADGLIAAQWLRDGKIRETLDYCRQDVTLEMRVIRKYLKDGGLILPASHKRNCSQEVIMTA